MHDKRNLKSCAILRLKCAIAKKKLCLPNCHTKANCEHLVQLHRSTNSWASSIRREQQETLEGVLLSWIVQVNFYFTIITIMEKRFIEIIINYIKTIATIYNF